MPNIAGSFFVARILYSIYAYVLLLVRRLAHELAPVVEMHARAVGAAAVVVGPLSTRLLSRGDVARPTTTAAARKDHLMQTTKSVQYLRVRALRNVS